MLKCKNFSKIEKALSGFQTLGRAEKQKIPLFGAGFNQLTLEKQFTS